MVKDETTVLVIDHLPRAEIPSVKEVKVWPSGISPKIISCHAVASLAAADLGRRTIGLAFCEHSLNCNVASVRKVMEESTIYAMTPRRQGFLVQQLRTATLFFYQYRNTATE